MDYFIINGGRGRSNHVLQLFRHCQDGDRLVRSIKWTDFMAEGGQVDSQYFYGNPTNSFRGQTRRQLVNLTYQSQHISIFIDFADCDVTSMPFPDRLWSTNSNGTNKSVQSISPVTVILVSSSSRSLTGIQCRNRRWQCLTDAASRQMWNSKLKKKIIK